MENTPTQEAGTPSSTSPISQPIKKSSNKGKVVVVIVGVLLLIGLSGFGGYYIASNKSMDRMVPPTAISVTPIQPEPTVSAEFVACTMDAKSCPDGSFVGRSGPKCEFAPCPGEQPTKEMKVSLGESCGGR